MPLSFERWNLNTYHMVFMAYNKDANIADNNTNRPQLNL